MIRDNMDMIDNFDQILDACIDRINRGGKIEDCLADYPDYADELDPLLRSMLSTSNAYSFKPRASAKQEARQRFSAALRESERQQEKKGLPFPWIFGKARAWAVLATVIVVALAGYFAVTQLLPSDVTFYDPDPEGNFAFYISDAPIDDFQSVEVTISKIRLQQEDGDWVEFEPETAQVNLTELQGDLAKEIWRGDLPQGQYTEADLYISGTSGMLKSNNSTVDIHPSGIKLQLEMNFEVSTETKFVYDITVTSENGKYGLQQVADGSGTGKKIQRVNGQGQGNGFGQEQVQVQDQEQCQGDDLVQCQTQEQNQIQCQVIAQGQCQTQSQGQAQKQYQGDAQGQGQDLGQAQYQGEAQGQGQLQDQGQAQAQSQVEAQDQGQLQGQEPGQEQSQGEAQEQGQLQIQEPGQGQSQGEAQEQGQLQGQEPGQEQQDSGSGRKC